MSSSVESLVRRAHAQSVTLAHGRQLTIAQHILGIENSPVLRPLPHASLLQTKCHGNSFEICDLEALEYVLSSNVASNATRLLDRLFHVLHKPVV